MITSIHNPKIQRVRALLARSRERRAAGQMVVEGVRLAEEAAAAPAPPELALYTGALSERGLALLDGLRRRGTDVEEVAPSIFEKIADTETSQGLLLLAPQPALPLPARLDFAVVCDTLRDPGNLGAVLRTAAAAGAQAALLSPECADPFSPKVLRAAMGAHWRLPILRSEHWSSLGAFLYEHHLRLCAAEVTAGQTLWHTDLRGPVAVMISNEAQGTSPQARDWIDQPVRIPMPGAMESLNAAVAAGVILFEVVRQRSERPSE